MDEWNGFKLKEGIWFSYWEEIIYCEGGEALAKRTCECTIPHSVQVQIGWNSGQPGLVEGVQNRVAVAG